MQVIRILVKPYNNSSLGKKEQVGAMFDSIAPNYDFLNHFLSFGVDSLWRKKAIKKLKSFSPGKILDIATGTGDLAIAAVKLNPEAIIGIDISEKMLEKGRLKIQKMGLEEIISLQVGDSEKIPFPGDTFDAITVAFGVRNFENLDLGLREMYRVLKPGGAFVILEFSQPSGFLFKQIFSFYFFKILPFIGKIVSKDSSAYIYLPDSVEAFPDGEDFLGVLEVIGFSCLSLKRLSFGIATIYSGIKDGHNNVTKL